MWCVLKLIYLQAIEHILVEALKDNEEDESSSIMHRGWGTLEEGGRFTSHVKGSSDRMSSVKRFSGTFPVVSCPVSKLAKGCGTPKVTI